MHPGLKSSLGYNAGLMELASSSSKEEREDARWLRDVLRFWTTGVAVVAANHDGVKHGMTVNSFTSLSLDPPLVLVSLEKGTRTHELVDRAGAYAVTLLSQGQRTLSERFAGRESEESDRLKDIETFELEGKSPILKQGLAFFDCRVTAKHDAGTHTLFIAEVLTAGAPTAVNTENEPLVYFNRRYRRLADS